MSSLLFPLILLANHYVMVLSNVDYNEWITVNETNLLPRVTYNMAVGNYDTSIFILGGGWYKHQLVEYDISNNIFIDHGENNLSIAIGTMDDAWFGQYYTHLDRIIYMLYDPNDIQQTARIAIFNMETKTFQSYWNSISVPKGCHACLTSFQNFLFIVGGYRESDNEKHKNTLQILNLTTNAWLTNPPTMDTGRRYLSCIVHPTTNELFAIGGMGEASTVTFLNTIEKVSVQDMDDIENQLWSYHQNELLISVRYSRAVTYDHNILIFSGATDAGVNIDQIQVINTISGDIALAGHNFSPMAGVVNANDILYAFATGEAMMSDIWKYSNFQSVTFVPVHSPTRAPTTTPTRFPTTIPTKFPTKSPSQNPSNTPTTQPTTAPTKQPSQVPSMPPSSSPTTNVPTTSIPTTDVPTRTPTEFPTTSPSQNSVPTTNTPISSVPTTSRPTTDAPTEIPTTDIPTTNIPTTDAPTTMNPTTRTTQISSTNISSTYVSTTMNPTTFQPSSTSPTKGPIATLTYIYGISIVITFNSEIVRININTTNLTNVINEVIQNIILATLDSYKCISFNIESNFDIELLTNTTVIMLRLLVCDEESKNELQIAFTHNLETDLITKINEKTPLTISNDVIVVSVGDIMDNGHIYTSTTILEIENTVQLNAEQQSNIVIYILSVAGCMLLCVVVIICILCIYKVKKVNKEFSTDLSTMTAPVGSTSTQVHKNTAATYVDDYTEKSNDKSNDNTLKYTDIGSLSSISIPIQNTLTIGSDTECIDSDVDFIQMQRIDVDVGDREFVIDGDSENEEEGVETKNDTGTDMKKQMQKEPKTFKGYPTPKGLCLKKTTGLDVEQWLTNTVKLPQYYDAFVTNGYETMQFIGEISDINELLEIGINTSNHQTLILDAIKNLSTADGDDICTSTQGYEISPDEFIVDDADNGNGQTEGK